MSWFSDKYYHPIMAGSIDGTDTTPHDHGIVRALKANYTPEKDTKIEGDPYKTLFVGRLNYETNETTLQKVFGKYGKIAKIRLVRDVVTGFSKGYAFITYEHSRDFRDAYLSTNHMVIDGKQILVDFERERICEGWIPRRFGGGVGGRKESGQLRFGGRDRPFRKSYTQDIPSIAFKRFDERKGIDKFSGMKYRIKNEKEEEERESSKHKDTERRDSKSSHYHHSPRRRSEERDRERREKRRRRSEERERDRERDKRHKRSEEEYEKEKKHGRERRHRSRDRNRERSRERYREDF